MAFQDFVTCHGGPAKIIEDCCMARQVGEMVGEVASGVSGRWWLGFSQVEDENNGILFFSHWNSTLTEKKKKKKSFLLSKQAHVAQCSIHLDAKCSGSILVQNYKGQLAI